MRSGGGQWWWWAVVLVLALRNSRGAPHLSHRAPATTPVPLARSLPPRLWARALTARLPPRRSFCPTKSLSLATADNFFITTSFLSIPPSTPHQRASLELLHCIRRCAPSSEARKVSIGMSATFPHSACTLRKMTTI